jgi:short subunit dehydrogenase-like uncharacterized protein
MDMGNRMIVEAMLAKNLQPVKTHNCLFKAKGGASGGTLASVMLMFETFKMKELEDLMNPFVIYPAGVKQPTGEIATACGDKTVASYDKVLGKWVAPFVMQACNTRIVHRSNALTQFRYGSNFVYGESIATTNPVVAFLIAASMPVMALLLYFRITRNLLKMVLPKPGEGPTEQQMQQGSFHFRLYGVGKDKNGKEQVVKGSVTALNGDPGYFQVRNPDYSIDQSKIFLISSQHYSLF